jgi:hypothetical protein
MKILIIATMVMSAFLCSAQDIARASVAWHSERTMNLETGELRNEATVFQTTPNGQLEWSSGDGSVREVYTVRERDGKWTNIATTGEYVYEIRHEKGFGTVTVERNSTGVKVRILLTSMEESRYYELAVHRYTVQ